MNILLCTIIRERQSYLQNWAYQIFRMTDYLVSSGNNITLSAYENDSSDDSSAIAIENLKKLKSTDLFSNIIWQSENINTQYYTHESSNWNARLENLSSARNKCLNNAIVSTEEVYDKIVFIEPDISYSPFEASEMIKSSVDYNILSGMSILYPKSEQLYDLWATRPEKMWLPLGSQHQNWFHWKESLSPVVEASSRYVNLASTFSGVCVYDSKPFYDGVLFSPTYRDNYDCDTVNICYEFIDLGNNNICMDKQFKIYHFR